MAKEINLGNFEQEVLKSDKPVLVDFYTPTCGPCRKLAPTITKLAEELADVAVIGKANVAENTALAVNHNISAVPTLILFKGGKEVERHLGIMSEDDLRKLIEKNK